MNMRYQDKPNRRMRKAKQRMWRYADDAIEKAPDWSPLMGFSILAEANRSNPYAMHFKWLEAQHALRYHLRMTFAWGHHLDTMHKWKRIPRFPGKT